VLSCVPVATGGPDETPAADDATPPDEDADED
jgi:hypothetical protein